VPRGHEAIARTDSSSGLTDG